MLPAPNPIPGRLVRIAVWQDSVRDFWAYWTQLDPIREALGLSPDASLGEVKTALADGVPACEYAAAERSLLPCPCSVCSRYGSAVVAAAEHIRATTITAG